MGLKGTFSSNNIGKFWPNLSKMVKKWFSMSKKGPNSGFRLRNKFLTKSVKKYCQKLFSRTKKGPNSGFWPRKKFRPNWSKNGQIMAKSCFLGLKRVQIVVFGQEFFFGKIGQKWPKYGEKLFFRPKKGPNSGFWPRIFF